MTVVLLTLTAFLSVLALLAWQLRTGATPRARPVVVLRRVYVTRVVETVIGPSRGTSGNSVTQSTSASGGSYTLAAAPTTRSS